MTSDQWVRGNAIREVMDELGHDSELIGATLAHSGISSAVLDDRDSAVPYSQERAFYEALADCSGNDLIGLELGFKLAGRIATISEYALLHSATVEQGLRNLARYFVVSRPVSPMRFVAEPNYVAVVAEHADPLVPVSGQNSEFLTGLLIGMIQKIASRPVRPLEVRFIHSRHRQLDRMVEMIGAPVLFGCTSWELRLKAEDGAVPTNQADQHLLKLIVGYGESVLAELPSRRPLLQRVQATIIKELQRDVSMQTIADDVGMSQRTLSRRLAEDGVTYRQVLDTVRQTLAQRYLADADIPLIEVAFLLGYTDQSSFIAAHRRWTGRTPGEERQLQAASASQ